MSRTDLIHYILENDRRFSMKKLVNYSYTELVIIKVRVELEKRGGQNESEIENRKISKKD